MYKTLNLALKIALWQVKKTKIYPKIHNLFTLSFSLPFKMKFKANA